MAAVPRTVWGWRSRCATLPWLGFVPDRLTAAPPVAVARLAEQMEIGSYGKRAKTRTEHARLASQYLAGGPPGRWSPRSWTSSYWRGRWEHDSPTLLFRLACEYLISARVIRPGPVTVVGVGTEYARNGPRRT
ncbi:DUF4158 domain-containing protein [Saccharopolyspora sp. NPDC000995]